jgi:hypothetical protein
MGSHGISEDLGWELYRLRFDVRSYHDPGYTGCLSVRASPRGNGPNSPLLSLPRLRLRAS